MPDRRAPETSSVRRDRARLAGLVVVAPAVILVATGLSVLVGALAVARGGAVLMAIGAAMISTSIVLATIGITVVLHVRLHVVAVGAADGDVRTGSGSAP